MYQEQLCKEAAGVAVSTADQDNVNDDMPKLISVTPPELENVAAMRHTEGSSSFKRSILNPDEVGAQLEQEGLV